MGKRSENVAQRPIRPAGGDIESDCPMFVETLVTEEGLEGFDEATVQVFQGWELQARGQMQATWIITKTSA